MDAQMGSGGTGFDAALKALEDLESDVAHARETIAPVSIMPAIEPISAIAPIEAIGSIEIGDPIETTAATEAKEAPVSLELVVADSAPVEPGDMTVDPEPQHVPLAVAPIEVAPAQTVALPAAANPIAPRAPEKRSKLPALAVALGLFSSIVSAVGLIVASRTIAGASLVVADARERAAELKKVSALVDELEVIRTRQQLLLRQQEATVVPVTTNDLDQRLGELREGLIARDQSKAMLDLVHDGQNRLNQTMGAIGAKVSRIEDKIDAKR